MADRRTQHLFCEADALSDRLNLRDRDLHNPTLGSEKVSVRQREMSISVNFLGHITYPHSGRPNDLAGIRNKIKQSLQENCFAGSVRAQNTQSLSGAKFEVETLDDALV